MNIERQPLVTAALSATRNALWGVAGISAVANLLLLTGPLFMLQIYDRVLASRSVPTLVVLSALALALYLFLGVFEIIRTRVLNRIGQQIEGELSAPAFDAVLTFPLKTAHKSIPSQPLRDLGQLRQFMSGQGPVAICDLPWLPIYMIIIFLFHSLLGWLAVFAALLLFTLTLVSEAVLRKPVRRAANLSEQRADFIEAGRRNAEALWAMGMRGAYADRWQPTNDEYLIEQARAGDLTGGFSAAAKVLRLALQSAVLALGAWLAIQQEISAGIMIAASILTSRALAPIEQATAHWKGFVTARQSCRRLREFLDLAQDETTPMPLPTPKKSLLVRGLFAGVPQSNTPIIREIGFELAAGQGLGIIGPSGSGKSTLARCLVGVWPSLRGTIRLDGAELNQWTPETLGPSIGYLPQGVELFDGTVAENISRFTGTRDSGAIIEAAERAGVHDLILTLPDGYGTRLGVGGVSLSAGQRQRVGLARALYGEPFLIVLDEPNANLDAEGEVALTHAILSSRQSGSIIIVVAHRPSALSAVDQALVLNKGLQVAVGPRDEVLRKTTVRSVEKTA